MQIRSNKLVEPVRLPQQIAKLLSDAIRKGSYKPGGSLPSEKQLSLDFAVSRAVIREAISILKYEGLVESRQGSGVFVTDNPVASSFRIEAELGPESAHDLRQLFQLRQYIESAAAELAAVNPAEDSMQEMEKAIANMERCIVADRPDSSEAVAADLEFHNAISRASGNEYLFSFIQFINAKLQSSIQAGRQNSARQQGLPEVVLEEHRKIFKAIGARDSAGAGLAMKRHIKNSVERLRLK